MPDASSAPAASDLTDAGAVQGTILAFDFGEKRIGVAIGETLLAQAHPVAVIRAVSRQERQVAIDKLVAEWQPVQLVVGLPTHADGKPHAMTERCRRFASWLSACYRLPVHFADERLTSRDAETRMRETGHNSKTAKAKLDAVAAQLILQTWFDTHHAHPA